jgi:hypothetical protein
MLFRLALVSMLAMFASAAFGQCPGGCCNGGGCSGFGCPMMMGGQCPGGCGRGQCGDSCAGGGCCQGGTCSTGGSCMGGGCQGGSCGQYGGSWAQQSTQSMARTHTAPREDGPPESTAGWMTIAGQPAGPFSAFESPSSANVAQNRISRETQEQEVVRLRRENSRLRAALEDHAERLARSK